MTVRSPFSAWTRAIFYALMLVFACHASTHMVAAGDTWVALACGRHFYNHGVNTVEPFSANSHPAGPTVETMAAYGRDIRSSINDLVKDGRGESMEARRLKWWAGKIESYPQWPQWKKDWLAKWHPTGWINQNWLTHLIFYWLCYESPIADGQERVFNALVYWKFAIYIIAAFLIYYSARLLKSDVVIAAVFTCFALFVGRSFLDIRPAGFSNVLVAAFIVLLLLATYRHIFYIWLLVPLVVLWCNLHGGYIYVFFMMAPFVLLNLATIRSKQLFISIGAKGVIHAAAASFTAFVAAVVFNPFHLTNLTHTYVISFSKHAEKWREVNEWHGAFEWTNPVGTGVPFLVMFIILLTLLALWLLMLAMNPERGQGRRREKKAAAGGYSWPKIDLALLAIVGLTVYMAIKSRRFIPIGAIVACPFIAMLLDQFIRMVAARVSWIRDRKVTLPDVPASVRVWVIATGLSAVLFFGGWWGWKFKTIYLDPWPSDTQHTSVFMRMTASNVKPFEACDFIRMNKLSGKMFNYWTEGGFVSWGQEPDPVTGRTPLQLFMDGRAQAAYDVSVYDKWGSILSGGPAAINLYYSQRQPTESDFDKMGDWIDEQLVANGVWVVLMPAAEFNDPQKFFTHALERHRNWRCIYYDGRQKILVRFVDARGDRIFTDVLAGAAQFPDEYSKDMSMANWLTRIDDVEANKEGFRRAKNAFEQNPTQESFGLVQLCYRREAFREEVDRIAREWIRQFDDKRAEYQAVDGYRIRLTAALAAIDHIIKRSAEPDEKAGFTALRDEWLAEFQKLVVQARW